MMTIRAYIIIGSAVFLLASQKSGGSGYRINARISAFKPVSGSCLYSTDYLTASTLVATCSSQIGWTLMISKSL